MTIGVLTSGGDAPGMNSAVGAVVRVAATEGHEVVGVQRGYQGLIDEALEPLTHRLADGRLAPTRPVELNFGLGGSFLGTARCKAFYQAEGRAAAAKVAKRFDGLVVIGGNGSLAGAHALHEEHGVPVVGIPASIDHDIGCTGTALGVDSALNTIVEACDRISDTARAHRRAFVVEVMGRQSGYLCMAGSVAAAADAALFREQGRSDDEIVRGVAELVRRSFSDDRAKQRVLIMKAEGVEIPCTKLVRDVQGILGDFLEEHGISIRATVLGHLVRGGAPTFMDRIVANRLAAAAVYALKAGVSDVMAAWQPTVSGGTPTQDHSVHLFPLAKVLEETQAMLDGTSRVTKGRVALMEKAAGVLALVRRVATWALALVLGAGCGGESSTAELVEAEPEAPEESSASPEEAAPGPHGGGAPAGALPTPITIAGGVAWVVEEPLVARRPSSPIRTAEYGVRGHDAAVLSVFHFTEAQGGGGPIDENVDRWVRQFTGPDGQPITRRQATVTETVVNGLPVTSVEVAGTFIGMRGVGGDTPAREGWRMLGAIVQGQLGPVFLKLTGPGDAVAAAEAAFRRLIESLHPA